MTDEIGAPPAPAGTVIEPERVLTLLAEGELRTVGMMPGSSNTIFLATVDDGDLRTLVVYKPRQGERPLWDFLRGTLCLREVAAYIVSQTLGWPLIPPAVLRYGPHGVGAVQLYIEADPDANYFTLREGQPPDGVTEVLRSVALFDHLTNNADRKGGHLLLDGRGRIWAIDHALTFHAVPKLRTVIWDFAGQPVPEPLLADLREFHSHLVAPGPLSDTLGRLLAEEEVAALRCRAEHLLETATFPLPDPHRRHVPWPTV